MDFLKKLLGGSGGGSSGFSGGKDSAMYVYVQPRGCEEVVRVRINVLNELSQTDDYNGFFVTKTVMGVKCFQRAELTLSFDKNKRLIDKQVTNGAVVDESAYRSWQASQEQA